METIGGRPTLVAVGDCYDNLKTTTLVGVEENLLVICGSWLREVEITIGCQELDWIRPFWGSLMGKKPPLDLIQIKVAATIHCGYSEILQGRLSYLDELSKGRWT